jgi:hypothetical protein
MEEVEKEVKEVKKRRPSRRLMRKFKVEMEAPWGDVRIRSFIVPKWMLEELNDSQIAWEMTKRFNREYKPIEWWWE